MKKALVITVLLLAGLVGCSRVPEAETQIEESVQVDSVVDLLVETQPIPIEPELSKDEKHDNKVEIPVRNEVVAPEPEVIPEEEPLLPQGGKTVEQSPVVNNPVQVDPPVEDAESPVIEAPTSTPELTSAPQPEQPTEEQESYDTEEVEAEEPIEEIQETIDSNAIAAYARSYAASLGFVIDTSLGQGNSGYYPPDYRPLNTMQDGYNAAVGLVAATKNQLNSRFSAEHSGVLVDEAYGLVRANCQVIFSHTDAVGDWYYIYVFYG